MNKYKRRDFLKFGSGLFAGLAIVPLACNNESKNNNPAAIDSTSDMSSKNAIAPLTAFGLQLYSLRDDFPKDPKGVLKQVADMGYKQVEGYERDKGVFWGMSHTDFKKYMDDLGMVFISSHCDTTKDFEKKAEEAAAIGMKYLVFPYEGGGKTLDDYKKYADDFNKKGEICKQNGIRFAFHNHNFSFQPIDGQFPQDILLMNTDPSLVDFEIDLYWVIAAGQDPETWLKKYPGRFKACHVKDRSKNPVEDNGKNSCNLGEGSIDYQKILTTAKNNGMQYYIVEQEAYPNGSPLEAAKVDADYMKKLSI